MYLAERRDGVVRGVGVGVAVRVGRGCDGEQELAGLLGDGTEGVRAVLRRDAQPVHRRLPEVRVLRMGGAQQTSHGAHRPGSNRHCAAWAGRPCVCLCAGGWRFMDLDAVGRWHAGQQMWHTQPHR
jgi:hypothetical protein